MTDTADALFSGTLKTCRAAFEMRQPDARSNAELLRDRFLREVAHQNKIIAIRHKLMAAASEAAQAATTAKVAEAYGTIVAQHVRGISFLTDKANVASRRAMAFCELLEDFRFANLAPAPPGPTPEAVVKGRGPSKATSITRLHQAGKLQFHHAAAAAEIAIVYEAVVKSLLCRSRWPDAAGISGSKSGGGVDYSHMPDWIADAHALNYIPWTRETEKDHGRNVMALVIDVVVDGVALDVARRHRRMAYPTALRKLIAALTLYARRMPRFAHAALTPTSGRGPGRAGGGRTRTA